MGQEQSTGVVKEVSREELSHELALKFADKCYSQLELYCFKQVFNNLADVESDVKYWSEASLCRFLELPDALGAGPVIYQMATFLGAFPFPSQAPCIVTKEALIKVVTIMTQRFTRVLKRGNKDRLRLFYGSLAVFDRRVSAKLESKPEVKDEDKSSGDIANEISKSIAGFAVDEPVADDQEDDDDDDDDGLALAALDSLDAIEAIQLGEKSDTMHSIIPSDNLLKLIELLLLIAPLGAQESLSKYSDQVDEKGLDELRSTANCIVATFGVETAPGITWRTFRTVVPAVLPHMFEGFNPLFEHFLFQKDFDLSKRRRRSSTSASQRGQSPAAADTEPFPSYPSSHGRRRSSGGDAFPSYPSHGRRRSSVTSVASIHTRPHGAASPIPEDAVAGPTPTSPHASAPFDDPAEPAGPLIPDGDFQLTYPLLSQLAFVLSPAVLFHRLYHLYSGGQHGFSIHSLSTNVATWTGPSLLLVSGTLLDPHAAAPDSRTRAFAARLPPRRFAPSAAPGARVRYAAFLPMQLRPTHRAPLADARTLLLQLGPAHDVFPASAVATAHVTFCTAATDPVPGLALGCALPLPAGASGAGGRPVANLGAVSLHLDDALEFGAFTHASAGGGSFRPSGVPGRRRADWEDRFEVDGVEVWGLGGDAQVREQRRALDFEEREARLRREGRGSVSAGGAEADRELLRMAGLIGQHSANGGSMS